MNDISCATDAVPLEGTQTGIRVTATTAALALIDEICAYHGAVLFHQSGGCCDGSSPMCYPASDFRIGASDVKLGDVAGSRAWISGPQFEVWKHTQLILDVVPRRGGMTAAASRTAITLRQSRVS